MGDWQLDYRDFFNSRQGEGISTGSGNQACRVSLAQRLQRKRAIDYRDKRLEGFDAASVVEVVEHLDPPRLKAFERVLFEFAKPRTVVMTFFVRIDETGEFVTEGWQDEVR